MAIVSAFDIVGGLEVRGRIGRPNELGEVWCGWSELGEYFPLAGLYRKRRQNGVQKFDRMKFYSTPGPRTPAQQANRTKLAQGVLAWRALSPEEKARWRAKRAPRYMSGYNRFLRDYMRDLL